MPEPSTDSPALGFLRSDEADPPVTVIRDIQVRPGLEEKFEVLMGALIAEANRQPGHLGATILRPHAPGSPYRFVYKFDRRSGLLAWHASATRTRLFEPVRALIASDRFEEYPGLETWFDDKHAVSPPKWKTTLLSWASITVLVTAFSYAMHAARLEMPIFVRAIMLTTTVVPIVAYIVGPLLGRIFHGWLHVRGDHRSA